jgi:hypothetical protein
MKSKEAPAQMTIVSSLSSSNILVIINNILTTTTSITQSLFIPAFGILYLRRPPNLTRVFDDHRTPQTSVVKGGRSHFRLRYLQGPVNGSFMQHRAGMKDHG